LAEISHLFAKPPETNFYETVTEILPESCWTQKLSS
jgi:hypothetical protein